MKSKKNVLVSPDAIAETYGADAARWFMLSVLLLNATSNGPTPASSAWRLVGHIWRTR
ncbi:MAG: hypothetical protein R3C58_10485 [Parvularculaceae bacterium]